MRRNTGPHSPRVAQLKQRLSRGAPLSAVAGREGSTSARLYARFLAASALVRNLAFVVVAAAVLIFLWRAIRDTSIYVEPISVPPSLSERGLSSTVLSDKIVDRIGGISRELGNPANAPEIHDATDMPAFQVFTFGPSLQSIGREIRRVIGKSDTRITGAITRNESSWHVAIRSAQSHIVAESDVPNVEPLQDAVVEAAAVAVLRVSNPGMLTKYQFMEYFKTGDRGALDRLDATVSFLESLPSRRDDPWVRADRALVSLSRGDFGRAQESYTRLAHDYPTSTHFKSMAAMSAVSAGHPDDANAVLNEIILSREEDADALTNAADTLSELGRSRDALALTERAMQANPAHEYARIEAAGFLCDLHRPSEAIALLGNWTAKAGAALASQRGQLAYCYFIQRNFKEVHEIRQTLERQTPDNLQTQLVRAMEAELQGDWPVALGLYKSVKSKFSGADADIDVSRVLLEEGNTAAAIPLLQVRLAKTPGETRSLWLLAMAYAMSGKYGAADAEYAKVIAADPDHVLALKEWSDVLAKLGRPDESRAKAALAIEAESRLSVPLSDPVLHKP